MPRYSTTQTTLDVEIWQQRFPRAGSLLVECNLLVDKLGDNAPKIFHDGFVEVSEFGESGLRCFLK